uniref:Uncharacterized protein n=1 Tax=Ixodes ricinus TaxID=34613 RepID=A0A6B0V3M5_IXORI
MVHRPFLLSFLSLFLYPLQDLLFRVRLVVLAVATFLARLLLRVGVLRGRRVRRRLRLFGRRLLCGLLLLGWGSLDFGFDFGFRLGFGHLLLFFFRRSCVPGILHVVFFVGRDLGRRALLPWILGVRLWRSLRSPDFQLDLGDFLCLLSVLRLLLLHPPPVHRPRRFLFLLSNLGNLDTLLLESLEGGLHPRPGRLLRLG